MPHPKLEDLADKGS